MLINLTEQVTPKRKWFFVDDEILCFFLVKLIYKILYMVDIVGIRRSSLIFFLYKILYE